MPARNPSDLDVSTRRKTAAKVYLTLAIGLVVGVVAAWIYLFSGPSQ